MAGHGVKNIMELVMDLERKRVAINTALLALIGDPKLVDLWWTSPNRAFEDKTPHAVFQTDPQQVCDYILMYFGGIK